MKTILLVEDDSNMLEIYSIQFKKAGYGVDMANNVAMALEKIKNNKPDLVVLDLELDKNQPGPATGISIVKTIRQDEALKNIKVMVASNFSEKDYPEISELADLGVIKRFVKAETLPEEIVSAATQILK